MLIELYIVAFSIITYGIVTTLALIGWGKLPRTLPSAAKTKNTHFISIIISARNEEKTIETCLRNIINQHFDNSNFELILIDDCSDDLTYEKALSVLQTSSIHYEVIRQSHHKGKKQNLAQAIDRAKGSIIVTSDADVTHRHPNWLSTLAAYFETYSPNALIMPVDFETDRSLLTQFQIIENAALIGIAAGYTGLQKPFMCSGANFAFKKKAYESVNGYQSHLHISSGDDVLLLEDIKKLNPGLVHYYLSRQLIVKTKAQKNSKDFINQRIRWGYKAKYNPNGLNLFVGFITLLANLVFLVWLVAFVKNAPILPYLSIFVIAKLVFDFLLLFLAADFLRRLKYMWLVIPFECIYWVYACVIGIASLFIKPYWKGKKIN